jgi:dCTP deaminase
LPLLHHEALTDALDNPDLEERLVVTPLLTEDQVGESSIDLRLGTDFLLLRRTVSAGIDLADPGLEQQLEDIYEAVSVELGGAVWLHPQQFVLGSTFEFVRIPPTCAAYVLGRSSWGRLGLLVATAVMIHPGFTGAITLELENVGDSPIKLYPGLKIAQLAVHALPDATAYSYARKYQSPTGPQASRLAKEQDELTRIMSLGDALQTP